MKVSLDRDRSNGFASDAAVRSVDAAYPACGWTSGSRRHRPALRESVDDIAGIRIALPTRCDTLARQRGNSIARMAMSAQRWVLSAARATHRGKAGSGGAA